MTATRAEFLHGLYDRRNDRPVQRKMRALHPWPVGVESRLGKHAPGAHRPPYACPGAIAYRLAAPAADHDFLLNDGPAVKVKLVPAPAAMPGGRTPLPGRGSSPARPLRCPRTAPDGFVA